MVVYSFGYRHGRPDVRDNDLVIDIRTILHKNPYHDRRLRNLRGDHKLVIVDILMTPHFEKKYSELKNRIKKFVDDYPNNDVYLGCTGGHHRSVYLANRIAKDFCTRAVHLNYNDK